MTKLEDALLWSLWWTAAFFAALFMVVGKLGLSLFRIDEVPPEDPVLLKHWRRKRLWLTISELSALPAFATIATTAAYYWNLPTIAVIPIAMVLGAVGFGALLNGVIRIWNRKVKEIT
jgi:hypothetical protein